MKNLLSRYLLPLVVLFLGVLFVFWMNHTFNSSGFLRDVFSGTPTSDVFGEVAADSPRSMAARGQQAARISMLIFSVITALQFLAFALAYNVLRNIMKSPEGAKVKLRKLENADIFLDVPLYVGLFGTVSAFLVMTFSPQSSRLIAYTSTLIGIVFCLILRLVLLFPFRQKLLSANGEEVK